MDNHSKINPIKMTDEKQSTEKDKKGTVEFDIKPWCQQGLERWVESYHERLDIRNKHGFGMIDCYGEYPDKIKICDGEYSPPEILEHFKKGDDLGKKILEIMGQKLIKVPVFGLAVMLMAGAPISDGEPSVKIDDDKGEVGEVDLDKMIKDCRSDDLRTNPILNISLVMAVKGLYEKEVL
jgi:hypothetical protein